MQNYEVFLKKLNNNCKTIINTSFLKASNNNIYSIDKSITLGFLSSFYEQNDEINKIISNYYDTSILKILNRYNENIKDLNYQNNVNFINHNKSIINKHIEDLIKFISIKKKQYNYNYKIDINDIEPFIIFDYFYNYYRINYENNNLNSNNHSKEILEIPMLVQTFSIYDSIFNKKYIGNDKENYLLSKNIFSFLDNKYNDYFSRLKENNKQKEDEITMDNNLKLYFNNVTFSYEDGKFYLIFKDEETTNVNKILDDSNLKETTKIKLPLKSEIISINDVKPSFQEILNCVRDMYYNFDCISLCIKDNNEEQNHLLETSSLLGERPVKPTNNTKNNVKLVDSNTPNLSKYAKELTSDYYLKDPSIGRDDEIRRLYQILLYPERDKSIIVTGDAGIGKTALIKGLAYRIQNGNVPKQLKNLKIYSLSVSTLVAGTKYVGTLEEKLQGILNEASKNDNIILFIDEIHQAIGAGTSDKDNNSVAEILKPYIDYGDVRVIGATTNNEYEEYVSSDEAFKTRFKRVEIKEPNESTIYIILDDLINKYNTISESKIKEENIDMIIKWLIKATDKKYRKYNDKASNPRLILDIIKEAYAISALNECDEVTIEHIIEAYKNEDRLYDSSKESQINSLRELKPQINENKIIQLKLFK